MAKSPVQTFVPDQLHLPPKTKFGKLKNIGIRGRNRQINIWHINNSRSPRSPILPAGYPILPARYPDENVYVPWVPHTAHKLLTLAAGRETPVTGKVCLCLRAFSFPEECQRKGRSREFREIHSGDPERAVWDDFPWRMRTAKVQGRANSVFAKPCLCLSDTRHFRHFRRFRGSEERSPCFQWVECKFVIFAVFVKTVAPFWQGTQTQFTKNTACATLKSTHLKVARQTKKLTCLVSWERTRTRDPHELFQADFICTECDWVKVPPYNGSDPRPPLVV